MIQNEDVSIIELSFKDLSQMIQKKKLNNNTVKKRVSIIGRVLNVGDKILTLAEPNKGIQKVYLISYNPETLRPLKENVDPSKENVYVRAIIQINISNNEQPILVLEKIQVLQKFNSKIYMKLLELEKDIIGELYGEMDRNI